jgi:PIN domain nuclease of toxin-antitoxin system
MIAVLDACAIIAFLRDEEGADIIEGLLLDPNNECFVHAINLCEVYYDFLRASDESAASSAINDVNLIGVVIREDLDSQLWQEAGRHKVTEGISLADCFAIALTNRVGAELVTSDHHEFDPIAARGVCSIRFFR